jgi:hypothetical protein
MSHTVVAVVGVVRVAFWVVGGGGTGGTGYLNPPMRDALCRPSTMSARLAAKLESLALLVSKTVAFSRYDATLLVTTAYVHPPAGGVDADTVTYHHEGRAVTFELVCITGNVGKCGEAALNGQLARLAHNAGFDWVTLVDKKTVYGSVAQDGCSTPIDLIFLLDSSGSIEDPKNYGSAGDFKDKEVEFVRSMLPHFDVGQGANQTRVVSAATFERRAISISEVKFLNGAAAFQPPSAPTHTDCWLRTARARARVYVCVAAAPAAGRR